MLELPILEEIAVIAAASVVVTVLLGRARLPTVTGLLASGALVGPNGFGFVDDPRRIEVIAEVGVVLLLFSIGLEFSIERLRWILRRVALGGALQVGATFIVAAAIARSLDFSFGAAVVIGFVFALSSTAIVLRGLAERRELDAPHGRFIVGVMIFQDLCVVPMVLIVPLLGGHASRSETLSALGGALAMSAVVVVGAFLAARLVVPRILRIVDASRSREAFLLAVVALCIGTAWLTSLAGLSLALGAFVGGVVVADTEFRHRAMSDILPLRDVLLSFFFISLGMLVDPALWGESPWVLISCIAGFTFAKGLLATLAALVMRFPARAAWLAGVGLANFSEFGFVIVRLATAEGIVGEQEIAPILNAGIISMFLTPVLLRLAPHFTAGERLLAPLARILRTRSIEEVDAHVSELEHHVVIVGYGPAGRILAIALRRLGISHVILDLNLDNVRKGRFERHPVYHADATSFEALGHAQVIRARAVVLLINDPQATLRVVDTLRRVAPDVPVYVRTHYIGESSTLVELGAADVVSEELEGSVEILARVLRALGLARNVIDSEIDLARAASKPSARTVTVPRGRFGIDSALAGLKVESVLVEAGSRGAGRSPRDLDLRRATGALLVAVGRGKSAVSYPNVDEPIRPGDVLYFLGDLESVYRALEVFVAADRGSLSAPTSIGTIDGGEAAAGTS
jgi:CPA2 family monovalent cation:H+ antiporter-2